MVGSLAVLVESSAGAAWQGLSLVSLLPGWCCRLQCSFDEVQVGISGFGGRKGGAKTSARGNPDHEPMMR